MAIYVSKAPAGSGKTRAVLQRIAHSPRTAEVYVPTHALAEESRQGLLFFNPSRRVAVIRGRGFELQPGVHLCQRQTEAAMLTISGLSVYPNLCLRRSGPGLPPDVCPYYSRCGYISQFLNAEVLIFTHAHLPLDRGILDEAMPSMVIIDEAFHNSLIEDITVPMALLTGLCDALLGFSGEKHNRTFEITVVAAASSMFESEPRKFEFDGKHVEVLEKVSGYYKDDYVLPGRVLTGHITKLVRPKDETAGTITLDSIFGEVERKVRVALTGDDYHLAVIAHDNGQMVRVHGDVHIKPKTAELLNPKNFGVIKMEDLI